MALVTRPSRQSPPLLAYKTDNWKLEIKSGIVAANLE